MKIIVCVKQVPDAKDVRLDPRTNTLAREGVQAIMNPYDRYALEAAVRVKEACGGEVVAISMGPPQAEAVLREAVACGADDGVLISDRAFAGADTWATTYTLAMAVRKLGGAELIVCGKQAIDGDTAQVGPGLAHRLGLPFVTCVRKIIAAEAGRLHLERLMDDGYDEVEVTLPALLTVVKEIGEPRVPSLKGKMRAAKMTVRVFNAAALEAEPAALGLAGSNTEVVRVFAPAPRGDRALLAGTAEEQVDQLLSKLEAIW